MDFLKNIKPYEIIDTSIGKLAIFDITLNEKTKIEDELNNNLQNSNGKEYLTALVKFACHKEKALEQSQSKPPERTLSDEEIKNLDEKDFEQIAKIYIENNEYLNKESIQKTKKDEKGVNVNYTKYGAIVLPKKENENYQAYLLRLEIEYNNKISESFKKSFGNIASFSKGIQESIRNTISFGEQLNQSLKEAQAIRIPKVEPIIPKSPMLDMEKLTAQIAENRERPFKELAERLDQLINITTESTKFMIEANKLQTRIAEEIKGSSNTSTKLSKINILIALIVLLLSIMSFAFSIYTVRISNKSNNVNIERAIKGLNTINETIKTDKEHFDLVSKRLNTLEHKLDSIKNRNVEIEKELKQLKNNLENPKKQ